MNKDKWTQQSHDTRLDDWTQQLREKLADYETPAPEGLWDDIEAALAAQTSAQPTAEQQPAHARHVPLRRWAAAAAIAALIAGGGLVLYNTDSHYELAENTVGVEETVSRTHHSPQSKDDYTPLAEASEETFSEQPEKPLAGKPEKLLAKQGKKVVTEQAERPLPGTWEEEQAPGQSEEFIAMENFTEEPRSDEETTVMDAFTEKPRSGEEAAVMDAFTEKPARNNPRRLSLNLYAQNGLATKDNSNAVRMADAMAQNYANTFSSRRHFSDDDSPSPIYLSGYEEQQHHRQPVALGLSVNYPLTERLSLTSGLVYTRLHADFTQVIRSQQISQEQTLHYLGVPLGLSYRLLQLGAFSAYVAAGVQSDLNISARQIAEGVERRMDRDRLQWSADASLGLQYALLPQLALYAEPGINHYFDNGSSLQNFFKDKPTSLRLQLGLRLQLP